MAVNINNGRSSRAGVYIEPVLYIIAQKEAERQGRTLSSYLRELIMTDLLGKNMIDNATLIELAK